MSSANISLETNNNTLNILNNNPSKNNLQESFKVPKNIGPYEIITKIKDGGYSKIYLAKSKYTGDNVCVKLIEKISFQENIEDLLLAKRQIETLKILKHRNILSLLEIYESPNYIFLITEYLSGKDLIEHLINKKRFSEEEAQKIFFQLIDALFYMHRMNICHRDLRSEHILFDKNNTPKIIGFSYSSFYTKNQKLKDSFGSLCYACPEIIEEESYDPELSDVWSLGVILYVMVCGYLPFSEENDNKNKELIIGGKIEFPKEMSNKLKDLIRHMLDINCNRRYNFSKIMKHPWFKPFNESLLIGGCNLYKMSYPVDDKILNIIQIYGFNKKQIETDMKKNKYNNGTGLFRHLVIKLNEMGFKSISDLGSKEFLQYSSDKSNYYKDGDTQYNEFLNKVQGKIEKIEKIISDFQEKEENIIQQLHNLEELNISTIKNNDIRKSKKYNSDENINIVINDQISEKSEKCEQNQINQNNEMKNSVNDDTSKTSNKRISHRRNLTPMFAFREFDDENENGINSSNSALIIKEEENNLNNKIGHINKNELQMINHSKKLQKKNNIMIKINKQLFNQGESTKRLIHSKSCPNLKNLFAKLLKSRKTYNYMNRNSINIDITKKLDDSHNITASYTKWRDTSMIIRRRKSYLNSSSFLDSYLKKPHPDNLRRNDVRNSLLNDINQIIIEENNNNSIINNSNISNNKINEMKKSKPIRYSLSFGDDDEDEDESSYISKIDSKQVSIYDIDEELILKEIGNNIKSPNLKNNQNNMGNIKISNFNDKKNFVLAGLNKNVSNFRNSINNKKIRNNNNTNTNSNYSKNSKNSNSNSNSNNSNGEKRIPFCNNQADMSFHEEIKENKTTNNNFSNNIRDTIIKSNSAVEKYNDLNKKDENKERDNNPIFKRKSSEINAKFEDGPKEINIFSIDRKIISKISLKNSMNEFAIINSIHNKEKNKYLYNYFKDIYTIKKLCYISTKDKTNIENSIFEIDKIRPHKLSKVKKKEINSKIKCICRNNNSKYIQRKTIESSNMKTKKDKNVVVIENNNTIRKNAHNSKEKLYNNGYVKNSNLRNINRNNNDITSKKYKKKEFIAANNYFIDNSNKKKSKLHKEIKSSKKVKIQNNNLNEDKNNNYKKEKSKIKSDLCNKFHEELNFTNISDLSEIRASSILSPTYITTNMENKNPNISDNQDNILFSNILPNKSSYISLDKSFQSQNKSKYKMYNLSVSHENNIICMGIKRNKTKGKENKEKFNNNSFYNNGSGKIKKIFDSSNSNININLEEINNSINSNNSLFNNNEIKRQKIFNYNYDKIKDKNNYNNNYIVAIKKRKLAEKLKEEIQKSINKNNVNFQSSFVSNGRISSHKNHIENDTDYRTDDYNPIIYNDIPQSNGKSIREKIIRSSSMLAKNNIYENNSNSKSKALTNNYNYIPIRHYDLNHSQYVTQYININSTNASIKRNININDSISAINNTNNQSEILENFDNFQNFEKNMIFRDSSADYILKYLQTENKKDEYQGPKKKNTIRIRKRPSNSVTYENGQRNHSMEHNHIIRVNRSKLKSNGKTGNKSKNILIKNIKYKCFNGKVKNIDLNNDNAIILSRHKKNYDCNNFPEKFITCSVPDLNNYAKSKNNLKYANNNTKEKQFLSDYNINKDKNNNKSVNKKSSVQKNNNEINKKYGKKINIKNNSNYDLINRNINNNKDKYIYKNSNNCSCGSSMDLNINNRKNKNINKLNKEINNKNGKFNKDADKIMSSKKERKKSGCSCKKNKFI